MSIGNGTAGKTESKKTECFLLSGLVHENYRPNKMIIMRLERFFLNLWVKRESKRPLKASFQEVEQLLMGHGASNSTGSKVKALSCQKQLFIT